jgi:hypothetical protein
MPGVQGFDVELLLVFEEIDQRITAWTRTGSRYRTQTKFFKGSVDFSPEFFHINERIRRSDRQVIGDINRGEIATIVILSSA